MDAPSQADAYVRDGNWDVRRGIEGIESLRLDHCALGSGEVALLFSDDSQGEPGLRGQGVRGYRFLGHSAGLLKISSIGEDESDEGPEGRASAVVGPQGTGYRIGPGIRPTS